MCDQAFADCADSLNAMGERYLHDDFTEPGRAEEVLNFVAFSQESTVKMLKHVLKGSFGYDCQLTDEQIIARVRETQKFRQAAQKDIGEI
ncbi:MAG TPA: hypothetical protein VN778_04315 [Verrucomicrobiae bacterium]|nr:hypothetical protein [Verrucomicrobiae bacterium]